MNEYEIMIDRQALKEDILRVICTCGWGYTSTRKSIVESANKAAEHRDRTGHILRKH